MRKANKSHKIKDAYDLQKARRDRAGFETSIVIAWMKNEKGKLAWRKDDSSTKKSGQLPRNRRQVRCIAYNAGDKELVWDAPTVRRTLLNPAGIDLDECSDIIPVEDSIFDPDVHDGVWAKGNKDDLDTIHQRFEQEANWVLHEVERLRKKPQYSKLPPFLEKAANKKLHKIEAAASRILVWVGLCSCPRYKFNAATALRQGIRIGMWLAELNALIVNAPSMKLRAYAGKGKRTGKFWKTILTKPMFMDKTPKEVLRLLDGMPDPEDAGKKMKLTEGGLKRGNGRVISEKSFAVHLSRGRSKN